MINTVVVVPCFNESRRLRIDKFREYVDANSRELFLFVDDGSTDNTFELLQELAASRPAGFMVVRLPKNLGKAEAVRQGFLTAFKGAPEFVGYLDADLATPLSTIKDFLREFDESPGLDLVMGSRVMLLGHRVNRKLLRHYIGRCFATAASLALGLRVYDCLCGAKLFRVTPTSVHLFSEPFHSRWIFDAEILARLKSMRIDVPVRVFEWPLREWTEVSGSRLRWCDFPIALFDLLMLTLRYRCFGRRKWPPNRAGETLGQ
ncbi:MAG: glycosyltransferase [Planctomycetaceae bacterium]